MVKNLNSKSNPNPNPIQDQFTKIKQGQNYLRNLIRDTRNTIGASNISFATTFKTIVGSIGYAYVQISNIFQYMAMMREFYLSEISNRSKNLITKASIA